jgi:hypothetical protein
MSWMGLADERLERRHGCPWSRRRQHLDGRDLRGVDTRYDGDESLR